MTTQSVYLKYLWQSTGYLFQLAQAANDPTHWNAYAQTFLDKAAFCQSEPKWKKNLLELAPFQPPTEINPLRSIFAHIYQLQKETDPAETWFHIPQPIQFSFESEIPTQGIFPEKGIPKTDMKTACKAIWKEFSVQLEGLAHIADVDAFATSLFNLLSRYANRVQAPQPGPMEDVSLFNWMRIAASKEICDTLIKDSTQPYLLLKGELSGIQDFLYSNIDLSRVGNQAKLAKRLRGRSFYIALYSEIIAEDILREFELPPVHLIFVGGGGFLIVMPNFQDAEERLARLQKEINLDLFVYLNGRTDLVLSSVPSGTDLFENSSKYYQEIRLNKNQKHKGYLKDLFAKEKDLERYDSKFKDDERIGERLPYVDFVVMLETKSEKPNFRNHEHYVTEFKYKNHSAPHFLYIFMPKSKSDQDKEEEEIREDYAQQVDSVQAMVAMEDLIQGKLVQFRPLSEAYSTREFTEALLSIYSRAQTPVSFVFDPVGTEAPFRGRQVMDFEGIQQLNALDKDREILSYPQMAVMRLDVDNLGSMFKHGLSSHPSFARTATLSREMALFFSGYFNLLARRWKVYVTYAGGDDAFVIGSWLNVMHFADELRDQFRKFTCENPGTTFSAGVFFCSPHYPVAKFAEMAGKAEDLAKDYKVANASTATKDAIHIFDHTLDWKTYKEMLKFGRKMLSFIPEAEEFHGKAHENDPEALQRKYAKMARSVVHRILRLIKASIDRYGNLFPQTLFRNSTQFKYLIARQGYKASGFDEELIPLLEEKERELRFEIIKSFMLAFEGPEDTQKEIKNHLIKNYLIPTQYVILKTRTK